MKKYASDDSMVSAVSAKVAALKEKPYAYLVALRPQESEELEALHLTLTVWRDELPSGETRIVVQAYRHFLLGFGQVSAQGFAIDKGGRVRDLLAEEIFDFI